MRRCVSTTVAFLFVVITSESAFAQDYVVTDLGTLGGMMSQALGINNLGEVVGASTRADGIRHAFLWQDGTISDLGSLNSGGRDDSIAYAINDNGVIAGSSYTAFGPRHAFVIDENGMSDIATYPCAGVNSSEALAINNNGTVAGDYFGCAGDRYAAVYLGGVWYGVGVYFNGFAYATNNSDEVVGSAPFCNPYNCLRHAFLWRPGIGTVDLGFGGAASGINDAEQIVGTTTGGAFVWQDGAVTMLGTLGGATSTATGINNAGQVVGSADTAGAESHAFVWANGAMTDLNDLWIVGGGPWDQFTAASAINDAGQIVGWGSINGETHAFVMTPFTADALTTRAPEQVLR